MTFLLEHLPAEILRYLYALSVACSLDGLEKGALATLVVTFVLAALRWRRASFRARTSRTTHQRVTHGRAA